MTTHRHRFKAVVVPVRKECSTCGAEGEPCEACGKWFALDDMKADAEGLYFCPACWPAPRQEDGK